jgi:hypothetical protein
MPAKDKRQIHLDPMEWKDAMKDIVPPSPGKKAPTKKKPAASTKKR